MIEKKNAFDLLRILLAICVLITHGILLGGYQLLDPLASLSKGQTDLGEFGVMGFFTLSGYLITASYLGAKNSFIFVAHRILRIFPGFWVCLIVTALVLAPLLYLAGGGQLNHFQFGGPGGAFAYIRHNFWLRVGQWGISGVLDKAAYGGSINGSLWSLFPELQCYGLTLIMGLFGLFGRNKSLLLLVTFAVLAFFAINFNFIKTYGPTVLILSPALKLYSAYLSGTLMFVFRDQLTLDKKGTILLALFVLVLLKFGGYHLLSPLLIAFLLINIFGKFSCKLRFDVSYGLYIYSFPLQQLLFQVFRGSLNIYLYLAMSFLLAIIMGYLSLLFVERPFMNLKQKADRLLA